MYNVEMYHKYNSLQRRDAWQCLEQYTKEIKWKTHGANIIDLGCGDGAVTTTILTHFIPDNCKALVGCDINEEMVQFANTHNSRDFISFTVVDIESDLPEQFLGKFDHAFSFYVMNWIKHQKIAFSNIYNSLTKKGDCLLMFLGPTPLYEVYRELARSPRWNNWMKNVERYVSPYHDCQDPEKDIRTMMTTTGFTNVKVRCQSKEFVYTGLESFKNFLKAVNFFKVPLEIQEDFFDDHIKLFDKMKFVDHPNNSVDSSTTVTLKYKNIIVYGEK